MHNIPFHHYLIITATPLEQTKSIIPIKKPNKKELKMTINVESTSSRRVVQETFFISTKTSLINFWIFAIIFHSNQTGLAGVEPATHGFGDRRSTNWSYRPMSLQV